MASKTHFLNIPAVYKAGTKGIGYLPLSLSYGLSGCIADISYLFYKKAVNNVKQNLSLVFPSLSEAELSGISRRMFRNYGRYLVDYGRFTNMKKTDVVDKIVHYDGKENLESALRMNKGVILLTAHLGNWELGGIFFGSYGIKTNVVTLRDDDINIDGIRADYRRRHNVATITIGNSPFSILEMVKALNNREIVAMLIDRYTGLIDPVTTDFFGRPSKFPRGPFILSRMTGAPIIIAFVIREEEGYRGIIEGPLSVADEGEEPGALNAVVKILEKYIIMYPDQWYNFVPI